MHIDCFKMYIHTRTNLYKLYTCIKLTMFIYVVYSSRVFHINGMEKTRNFQRSEISKKHGVLIALSRDCLDQSDNALYRILF